MDFCARSLTNHVITLQYIERPQLPQFNTTSYDTKYDQSQNSTTYEKPHFHLQKNTLYQTLENTMGYLEKGNYY